MEGVPGEPPGGSGWVVGAVSGASRAGRAEQGRVLGRAEGGSIPRAPLRWDHRAPCRVAGAEAARSHLPPNLRRRRVCHPVSWNKSGARGEVQQRYPVPCSVFFFFFPFRMRFHTCPGSGASPSWCPRWDARRPSVTR